MRRRRAAPPAWAWGILGCGDDGGGGGAAAGDWVGMGSEWSGWEAAGRAQSGEMASSRRRRMAARVLVGFLPTKIPPPGAIEPRNRFPRWTKLRKMPNG